jgi:hypothetical protein
MTRFFFGIAVALGGLAILPAAVNVAVGQVTDRADEAFGTEIDLSAFGEEPEESSDLWNSIPITEASHRFAESPRRFYLSGMIGPSFATVVSPDEANLASDETLFAAGGAPGIAFERRNGRLRLELEGMGRSTSDAPITRSQAPDDFTILTSNWSAAPVAWRVRRARALPRRTATPAPTADTPPAVPTVASSSRRQAASVMAVAGVAAARRIRRLLCRARSSAVVNHRPV